MSYSLNISGKKILQRPSEADIRAIVSALDARDCAAFLVLGLTETFYIQAAAEGNGGFDVEYQENEVDHRYRAKRHFTADETVKVLVSFKSGGTDWKQMADWERVRD